MLRFFIFLFLLIENFVTFSQTRSEFSDRMFSYYKNNEFTAAKEYLDSVIQNVPNCADCYLERAKIHIKFNKIDLALFDCESSISINDSTILEEVLMIKAVILSKKQRNHESYECYQQILKINPSNPIAMSSTGMYLLQLFHERAEGEELIEKAFKLNPKNNICRYNYAMILIRAREYEDAIHILEELEDTENPGVYYLLGEAYMQMKLYDYALKYYSSAKRLAVKDPSRNEKIINEIDYLTLQIKKQQEYLRKK